MGGLDMIKYDLKDIVKGYYNGKKINKLYRGIESPSKGRVIYERIGKDEPVFQGKWIATFADGHTESAECNTISAITRGEITLTDLVNVALLSTPAISMRLFIKSRI